MKTTVNSIKKVFGNVLFVSILLSFSACNNAQKNQNAENSNESKAELEAPAMDIHTTTFMGNIAFVRQHIKAGTDLNQKDQYGSTPLAIAATFDKTEIAKELIAGGADINLKNAEGSTPLHIAAFFCRTEIVEALLKKGADKTALNNYGSTALQSVSGPYTEVKPIYEQFNRDLGPLGLKLDYNNLENTRPVIAEMLK